MACDDCPVARGELVARAYTTLLLYGYDHDPRLEALVGTWTTPELEAAYEYAALEYLAASDNDVTRVPRPPHLPETDTWGHVLWPDAAGTAAGAAGVGEGGL